MEFPALEVLAATHGPAVGERLPVTSRLRFGRGADCEVNLRTPLVSKLHCGVFVELGGVWLRDLGSEHGTRLNGERVTEEELHHGDVVEVAPGHAYEVLLHERAPLREPSMEAAVIAAPEDDALRTVYADWLAEHAAPSHLGALCGDVARGEVQVVARAGLPWKVVLRSLQGAHADWSLEARLAALGRVPAARLLRELEIDLPSFLRRELDEVESLRRLLGQLNPERFPSLGRLLIGPTRFTDRPAPSPLEVELRLWRRPAFALESSRPLARVSLDEQPLDGSGPWSLHDGARIDVEGQVATFSATWGVWRVERSGVPGTLRLNGVALNGAFVRPGDRIQVANGVWLLLQDSDPPSA